MTVAPITGIRRLRESAGSRVVWLWRPDVRCGVGDSGFRMRLHLRRRMADPIAAGHKRADEYPRRGDVKDTRWLNPNGQGNWLADVEKWRANLGVSHEHLSYEVGFWNVEGSFACAVLAGTLTITLKGQTIVRTGTLANTFSKHGQELKIDAQAWGRTS